MICTVGLLVRMSLSWLCSLVESVRLEVLIGGLIT